MARRHLVTRGVAAATALAALVLAVPAASQDAAAGRTRYLQACAVCHGPAGLSAAPDTPHLAGQPAIYLARQLKQYRDGTRRHEVMAVIAKPLSDADIEAISAWLASIRVEATPP
jgi:cytochrome c553